MKSEQIKSGLLLFLAACIWGAAFVAQSAGMEYMGPFTFNAARFLLGGTVLLPLIAVRERRQARERETMGPASDAEQRKRQRRVTLFGGVCCGLAICLGSSFQQLGIQQGTSVGKAGFITTLYIIMVPILGLFLGKKPRPAVWAGALLAAAGMYLLCMNETLTMERGDVLLLICAFMFSLHILVIDYFSPKADGVKLSCIQFYVSGLISLAAAFLFEAPTAAALVSGRLPICYAGIMSCGVAYTLQIIGQKGLDAAVASLILCMESVVSVLAGWLLLSQALSGRELTGCLIVFAAVILVQLPRKQKKEKTKRIVCE